TGSNSTGSNSAGSNSAAGAGTGPSTSRGASGSGSNATSQSSSSPGSTSQGASSHGSGSTGSTSHPSSGSGIDLSGLRTTLRAVDAALAKQQTACAPVLGSSGTGDHQPTGPSRGNARPARLSATGTPLPNGSTPSPMSTDTPGSTDSTTT